VNQQTAILACPIVDNERVLGDVWLFKPQAEAFSNLEIRLVQQVVNQGAIAIRQARLHQATQAQVKELEKLNRLKDDFLSTVSHELRTPMSNIKMATQMLEIALRNIEPALLSVEKRQSEAISWPETVRAQKGSDQANERPSERSGERSGERTSENSTISIEATQRSKVARYFKILHDECQRETTLINDLLDLSRLDAGAEPLVRSPVDPQRCIQRIAERFSDRTRDQDQMLILRLAPDLPWLETDLSKLERILTELLNNACKYTPAGGTITLSAQPITPTTLRLGIKNTGTPIPDSELDRIFDKFYRIPDNDPWKHGGTGLGLALVQKLVIYLGGTIWVENGESEICFSIELPSVPTLDISELTNR
nr:HAMP domain-containing histidine kinase [Oculatellaceae cyanobacterium Prado106]